MVKFIADSSSDLLSLDGINYESVPLTIYTEKKQFTDDGTVDIPCMLALMENYYGRSYTSCPSVDAWLQAFEGADEIYVAVLTSGLSGAYNSALIAKQMYLEQHPHAKIAIFDTLSTGPEIRMCIEKLIELKVQEVPFETINHIIPNYLDRTHLFFVLNSLHNLAQNGRVNKVVAHAIGTLGINIIGIANDEGKITPVGKARGNKKIVNSLLEEFEQIKYDGGKIRISHIENEELSNQIAAKIRGIYPDADIEIYEAKALCSYYAERKGVLIGIEGK